MYKAIIFDFFDVIHTDCYHAWMRAHGHTRKGEFAEASRQLDRGDIKMKEFYQKLSLASGLPADQIETDFIKFSKIDTDMVSFIRDLHNHYPLGLLSNADGEFLRPILENYKLTSLFDVIIISSEVHIIKPDPEVFLLILKKLNIKPEEAIFIDDHEHNVEAAKSLGITGIRYLNLQQLKQDLQHIGIKTH